MTPAPCWTGYFDQGDGVVFRNGAQDIQIANAQLQSNSQAALHILNSGKDVHVTGNVMGYANSVASYDCVNVDTTAIPNLQIVGNDCTGVTHVPIVYASPYPLATPSF